MRALPHPLLSTALVGLWMVLTRFSPGQFVLGALVGLASGWAHAALTPASPPRIRTDPTRGKIVVPSELNACAKVSRLGAVSGAPSIEISGLATTCTIVIPAPSTNSATRNSSNVAVDEAGMKSRHPTVIVTSPIAAVRR